jgi:hypothetical protein
MNDEAMPNSCPVCGNTDMRERLDTIQLIERMDGALRQSMDRCKTLKAALKLARRELWDINDARALLTDEAFCRRPLIVTIDAALGK